MNFKLGQLLGNFLIERVFTKSASSGTGTVAIATGLATYNDAIEAIPAEYRGYVSVALYVIGFIFLSMKKPQKPPTNQVLSVLVLAAGLVLIALAPQAGASTIYLTWTPPAAYDDSDRTPVGPGEIDRYTINWLCNDGDAGSLDVPPEPTSKHLDLVGSAPCSFTITATATNGKTSALSNRAEVTQHDLFMAWIQAVFKFLGISRQT